MEYFELDFGFPCKVHEGIIEKLRIKIPWKNINEEKIDIELDNFIIIFKVTLKDFQEYIDQSILLQKTKLLKGLENYLLSVFKGDGGLENYIWKGVLSKINFVLNSLKVIFSLSHDKKTYYFGLNINKICYV